MGGMGTIKQDCEWKIAQANATALRKASGVDDNSEEAQAIRKEFIDFNNMTAVFCRENNKQLFKEFKMDAPTQDGLDEYLPKYSILKYFYYGHHFPEHLQTISCKFAEIALVMVRNVPNNAETSAGLRKLLEAKDCFMRAGL